MGEVRLALAVCDCLHLSTALLQYNISCCFFLSVLSHLPSPPSLFCPLIPAIYLPIYSSTPLLPSPPLPFPPLPFPSLPFPPFPSPSSPLPSPPLPSLPLPSPSLPFPPMTPLVGLQATCQPLCMAAPWSRSTSAPPCCTPTLPWTQLKVSTWTKRTLRNMAPGTAYRLPPALSAVKPGG